MKCDENMYVPTYAQAVLTALEDAGYESWLVGGCVRDALLGRDVHDYDIATAARWEQASAALQSQGFTVHPTGTQHGTITAVVEEHALEITTFRADSDYSDGRHPDTVTFVSSIREDLARRDFTVNALAYHPQRGLFDCWGGIDDLNARVIRTVGDPHERFMEDGLRVLRGCRFASQLGFALEPETLDAMKSHKMMLARVSYERIAHELDGLLLGDYVHDALMETVDVLVAVLPEVAACRGFEQHTPYHIYDVWEHIAWVVQYSPATRLSRWAALFHDIGKPGACFFEGERAHFFGHPKLSAVLAEPAMKRLLFPPKLMQQVLTLVRMHDVQIPATSRNVRRALMKLDGDVELMRALISLKKADTRAQSQLSEPRAKLAEELDRVLDEIVAENAAFSVKQLAVNGCDVLDQGVPAGPAVGALLQEALEAVVDGHVANERDALLAFLRERA